MTEEMTVRIRSEIAALAPYRQGKEAPVDAFKLSSNENPFDPLPKVLEALSEVTSINRYPDATAGRLRERLAARYDLPRDSVYVGAGSASILAQLLSAVITPGDEVVYAWRSFEAYPGMVLIAGADRVAVPLTAEARHDLPAMARAVTDRTRAILLCSPNNPTGTIIDQDEFDEFVEAVPRDILIILDEAYAEFVTDPSAVDGIRVVRESSHANVVAVRTFSKAFGLAGLRIGYAVGDPRILQAARATAVPLAVTALAEEAALASLDAEDELLHRVRLISERRDALVSELRAAGWRIPDAQGNFVWLHVGRAVGEVTVAFEERGLIVRPFPNDGIRITVGEEGSVERILRIAASVLQSLPEDALGREFASHLEGSAHPAG